VRQVGYLQGLGLEIQTDVSKYSYNIKHTFVWIFPIHIHKDWKISSPKILFFSPETPYNLYKKIKGHENTNIGVKVRETRTQNPLENVHNNNEASGMHK